MCEPTEKKKLKNPESIYWYIHFIESGPGISEIILLKHTSSSIL
jgi:hypothetical protein